MSIPHKSARLDEVEVGDWIEVPVFEDDSPVGTAWKQVKDIVAFPAWGTIPSTIEFRFADGSKASDFSAERVVRFKEAPVGVPNAPLVPEWDEYFLGICEAVAKRAKCRRRQVGSVLVTPDHRIIGTGYNGFPSGSTLDCLQGGCPRSMTKTGEIPPDSPYTDPVSKGFCPALHAESNCLIFSGEKAKGCTLYVNAKPCPDCSRLVAGAGVKRVVWPDGEMNPMDFYTPDGM